MTVEFATKEDVLKVLDSRREDVELAGLNTRELVEKYLDESQAFVGYASGVPGCAWGISMPKDFLEPNQVWLATTSLVEKHKFAFLRGSRWFIEWAVTNYGVIGGLVQKKNERSVRWLKWLGFSIGDEIDVPLLGASYPFQKRLERWPS